MVLLDSLNVKIHELLIHRMAVTDTAIIMANKV